MYGWQQKKQKKKMRNAVVWPSLTSLRWAERFMMMMTTRVDGAQFRLALLFSSWTTHTHPAANINNDGRLVWKQEKKKNTFAWPVMYSSRAPVVCLFIIDTNVRENERTDRQFCCGYVCVYRRYGNAPPLKLTQPDRLFTSLGRSVGASTFDHI